MVPRTHRSELDRRHPDAEEGDGIGGAVATDAHRLPVVVPGRRRAQRLHVGGVALDRRRRAGQPGLHLDPLQLPHLGEDLLRVLVWEVANVDVDHASVRHLVESVAADDPPQVDRRPVEELRAVSGKR